MTNDGEKLESGLDILSQEEIDKTIQDLLSLLSGMGPEPVISMADLSHRFPEQEKIFRVELRRQKLGVSKEVKSVEDKYLIGLLPESDLPEEGEAFRIYYHNYNGMQTFNYIDSGLPVSDVLYEGEYIYFTAAKVDWRLQILDSGN